MPTVAVVRETPKPAPPPRVVQVNITLTGEEAVSVAALLGQFGHEYDNCSALYKALTRQLGVWDGVSEESVKYDEMATKAHDAIEKRAQLNREFYPNGR